MRWALYANAEQEGSGERDRKQSETYVGLATPFSLTKIYRQAGDVRL